MKLTISILFCVILTLQYNGADGQSKDLFGRIHESVTKVKQDVHNLFNPDEKKQQENKDESTNIHFEEEESQEDFAAAAAARKPAEVTLSPPTSTSTAAPVTTTAKNETEEEKDGRENFAGGCVPGYMRTPDGRCKPTFLL